MTVNMNRNINIPIHVHSHATAGLASLNLVAAVEAGATIIDTCNSSFSEGASHPTTESIIAALQSMGYEINIDIAAIESISEHLREVRKKYWQFESEFTGVDPRVLSNQVPGGMISNLSNQLKDQNALEKMNDVLKEIPLVRQDLGFPPLVTPTSQIVGTQAALNVITGSRYKTVTNEVKNYFLGQYGAAPGKVNEEIKSKAIGDQKAITCRPADKLKPEINNLRVKADEIIKNDEDLLTYAMFPDLATSFLKERNAGTLVPEELLVKSEVGDASNRYAPSEFNITLHGETYHINITGSGKSGDIERPFHVSVDGISEEVLVETLDQVLVEGGGDEEIGGDEDGKPAKTAKHARPTHDGCITTAMPGTIIDIKVKVGDTVSAGDSVIVIEAMKMENEIQASKSGIVIAIHVSNGDSVSPNETLIEIKPQ